MEKARANQENSLEPTNGGASRFFWKIRGLASNDDDDEQPIHFRALGPEETFHDMPANLRDWMHSNSTPHATSINISALIALMLNEYASTKGVPGRTTFSYNRESSTGSTFFALKQWTALETEAWKTNSPSYRLYASDIATAWGFQDLSTTILPIYASAATGSENDAFTIVIRTPPGSREELRTSLKGCTLALVRGSLYFFRAKEFFSFSSTSKKVATGPRLKWRGNSSSSTLYFSPEFQGSMEWLHGKKVKDIDDLYAKFFNAYMDDSLVETWSSVRKRTEPRFQNAPKQPIIRKKIPSSLEDIDGSDEVVWNSRTIIKASQKGEEGAKAEIKKVLKAWAEARAKEGNPLKNAPQLVTVQNRLRLIENNVKTESQEKRANDDPKSNEKRKRRKL